MKIGRYWRSDLLHIAALALAFLVGLRGELDGYALVVGLTAGVIFMFAIFIRDFEDHL
jgi:hypothetical protein